MDFFFLVAIIKIGETMKKKILLIMLPVFIIGILSVILIVNHKEKEPPKNITPSKENKEKKHCTPITGGSFNLIFNTNSDKTIENMTICIACAPDTYKDLPQAEKEEYIFEGWYYDKELTKKVEVTNTKDIQPIPIEDEKCTTGYEDINLYANYTKIEKKIEETPVIQSKTIQTQPENNNQIETPPQIEEHLFWVKLYPANILDKMTVTFIIPQSRTGTIEDIIVCYMGYHDFIKFLDDNRIIINNKRMKTTFSNAIEKDKLNFMYKSIVSEDRDYSFDMDTYDKNNYACNRIIEEIKENHFAYNEV